MVLAFYHYEQILPSNILVTMTLLIITYAGNLSLREKRDSFLFISEQASYLCYCHTL